MTDSAPRYPHNITLHDNYTNSSASPQVSEEEVHALENRTPVAVLGCAIFILNVAAFVFICIGQSLKKPLKILIESQIISDLLLMLIFLMFPLLELYQRVGSPFCYPFIVSIASMISVSYLTISLFAVLNYVCVMRPIAFRISVTAKLTAALVLVAWVMSFVLAIISYGFDLPKSHCVPLYYMKRHGLFLHGLTWGLSAVSVVVFNTLTINLLRKSGKTMPIGIGETCCETNARCKKFIAEPFTRPTPRRKSSLPPYLDSYRLLYHSTNRTKSLTSQTNYSHSTGASELSQSSTSDQQPQHHANVRHSLDAECFRRPETISDNSFYGICLHSIDNRDLAEVKQDATICISLNRHMKKCKLRYDSRSKYVKRKEAIDNIVHQTEEIQHQPHGDQSNYFPPTSQQKVLLCPEELSRYENRNLHESYFTVPSNYTFLASKPNLHRRYSESALTERTSAPRFWPTEPVSITNEHNLSMLKRQNQHFQCTFQRDLCSSKEANQEIERRPAQTINTWRSPHNRKKLKVILTLMILSMWSLAFNLPMTIHMMWRSMQRIEYEESDAAAPTKSIGFIMIGCLGNTFLYAWRFVDYQYLKLKFQALCACPWRT